MKKYELTFNEALELAIGGMYIRSNIMKDGIFLKLDDLSILCVYDGFNLYKKLNTFIISTNSYNAKWMAFNIANKDTLTL